MPSIIWLAADCCSQIGSAPPESRHFHCRDVTDVVPLCDRAPRPSDAYPRKVGQNRFFGCVTVFDATVIDTTIIDPARLVPVQNALS